LYAGSLANLIDIYIGTAPATKTLGTATTHATDAVMRMNVAQGVETLLGTLETTL
jgi:hypothetical protein